MAADRLDRLPTEQPNPSSRGIDTLSLPDVLRIILRQEERVPRAVYAQRARIARAAALIVSAWRAGGRLIFAGAGTSGRLGVMEAAECPPTFGVPPGRVRALMAGGRGAVFRAREGAEDDAADGARRLGSLARPGDAVIGIAASGVTPFVRGALEKAKRLGCKTVLVTANVRARVAEADVLIAPAVGPEVIAGSTRLKAGTAEKLVLNALTTATMIQLGKVYDHWMVDLRPASAKLRRRAQRIVRELGKVGPARARALLAASGGSVNVAIVMARWEVGAAKARSLLRQSGGILRRALEEGP